MFHVVLTQADTLVPKCCIICVNIYYHHATYYRMLFEKRLIYLEFDTIVKYSETSTQRTSI